MPKPRAVVIVSDDAEHSGGAASVAIDSAQMLRADGIDVHFFAGRGPVSPKLEESGIALHCLDANGFTSRGSKGLRQGFWDAEARKRFREVLARLDPVQTVIHVHSYINTLSASVPSLAQQLGFPLAFTLHEYNFGCPYGGFFDYRLGRMCGKVGLSAGCLTTNCTKTSYARKLWRFARLVHQRGVARVPSPKAWFLSLGDLNERVLRPYLPPAARVVRVPNGIDIQKRERVEAERMQPLLFVGRLSAEKGAHLFVQAAEEAKAPYTVVGSGEAEQVLRRMGPNGRFLGWLDRDGVAEQMRNARALVFPSMWLEGQPLTVLEALGAGLPVIASRRTAAEEMVEHGTTGLHFEYGSIKSLRRSIETLQDDRVTQDLSRNAYDTFWEDPPTLAKHRNRLLEVYSRMLEERP